MIGLYRPALLHPAERNAEQRAHNDRAMGPLTLGIEVTVPALAARCGLGNIDPQHGAGTAAATEARAAIEACAGWPLPPDGAVLATVRPDIDAVGGMALFALRRAGVPLDAAMRRRIAEVARRDCFDNGAWPGPRPLPETAAEFVALLGGGDGPIGAVAAAVSDHDVGFDERVAAAGRWLSSGEAPAAYAEALEARARRLAEALAGGDIRLRHGAGGRIASVEGNADGAIQLGYCIAPVVVALAPAFRFRGGPPHRKFTVCQYRAGHIDLRACLAHLAAAEPGWGGSATIIGSPQGQGSALQPIEVVAAVCDSLIP